MEPAFHRGDLLFLTNPTDEPIRVESLYLKLKEETSP